MSDEEGGRRRSGLGRGLDALFGSSDQDFSFVDKLRPSRFVPIEQLEPSPYQPRRLFDPDALTELVASIRQNGVLQPILVRPSRVAKDRYEIVAGERRWRAAQQARIAEVPVVVKELDDRQSLELAIIENVQRQDLTPLEEARGFHRLITAFGHTQERVAEAVGKSRSHVANTLRLLELPETVCNLLETGRISAGHARALLGAADPDALAAEVVSRALNVRQTEQLVRSRSAAAPGRPGHRTQDRPGPQRLETETLERELGEALGLRVRISRDVGGPGILMIDFRDDAQLNGVIERLKAGPRRRRPPAD